MYASDEDGAASASTEADEAADGTDSGSDAADEVDAFFCTLIRAGRARSAAPGARPSVFNPAGRSTLSVQGGRRAMPAPGAALQPFNSPAARAL